MKTILCIQRTAWVAAVFAAILALDSAAADPAPTGASGDDGALRWCSLTLSENGIYYLPFGTHIAERDFAKPHMVGLTYGPISVSVYQSSVEGQGAITSVVQAREVFSYRRLGADVVYGLMHGYEGELAESDQLPQVLQPLMGGHITPIVALSPFVRLSDKWEVRSMLIPSFFNIGLKYKF